MNTVRSHFSADNLPNLIYVPGLVFVADATTMYHYHAHYLYIVVFSCLTLQIQTYN